MSEICDNGLTEAYFKRATDAEIKCIILHQRVKELEKAYEDEHQTSKATGICETCTHVAIKRVAELEKQVEQEQHYAMQWQDRHGNLIDRNMLLSDIVEKAREVSNIASHSYKSDYRNQLFNALHDLAKALAKLKGGEDE